MAASYGQQPAHGAAWARVQLVRGQSGAQHWAIDGQYPEARLTIGSAPDAGWQVQGVGVQPYHFELFWDGRSLWVSDTRRVGSVTINGRPVGEWVQVRGRSEISFGSAGMQLETADAMTNEMASSPGEARRVTVAPGEGWNAASFGAPMAANASSQPWDDSSLPGEATRVAAPPSESMGQGGSGNWAEMDAESTRIAHEAAIPGLPSLSGVAPAHKPLSGPPPPMMRPRLGGGGPASMASAPVVAPGRDMARTITADEMSHHLAAAQQIAQGVQDPAGTSPSVVVQSGYPQQQFAQGGFAQPQQGYGAPQQGFAPGGMSGGGGPQSGFMAPPTFDQAHQDATAKPQGKKRALPIRTLLLLVVTVLAAVGLIFMAPGAEPVPVATPQPAAGTVPAALPQGVPQAGVPQPLPQGGTPQAGVPQPLPQGGTPQAGVPQPLPQGGTPQPLPQGGTPQPLPQGGTPQPLPEGGDPQPTGAAGGAAETAPTTPGGEVVPVVPVGPTPDRIAADLVITGRYADALPQYQQLAAAHPERPEYAQMVRILQQRLAGRCQGGVGPDGRPCTGR